MVLADRIEASVHDIEREWLRERELVGRREYMSKWRVLKRGGVWFEVVDLPNGKHIPGGGLSSPERECTTNILDKNHLRVSVKCTWQSRRGTPQNKQWFMPERTDWAGLFSVAIRLVCVRSIDKFIIHFVLVNDQISWKLTSIEQFAIIIMSLTIMRSLWS